MVTRVCATSGPGPTVALPEALPSMDQVRRRLEGAISRRELLKRSVVLTATGITAMTVKAGLPARSIASGTATQVASGTGFVPEYARFMEFVGTTFAATSMTGTAPAQRAALTLEEVVVLGDAADTGRPAGLREIPYALRFLVSQGELATSGVFRLRVKDHPNIDTFIHQVGMRVPGGDVRYEAVFN